MREREKERSWYVPIEYSQREGCKEESEEKKEKDNGGGEKESKWVRERRKGQRGKAKESSIKSHPLPTPLSRPTWASSCDVYRTHKGLTDLICSLRNGERERRSKKERRFARGCVYASCGVKGENPLSRLTYSGRIFCNVDETSWRGSCVLPMLRLWTMHIMARGVTILG